MQIKKKDLQCYVTCKELKIVNKYVNTSVLLSWTERKPNTQVNPNRGISVTVAFKPFLK